MVKKFVYISLEKTRMREITRLSDEMSVELYTIGYVFLWVMSVFCVQVVDHQRLLQAQFQGRQQRLIQQLTPEVPCLHFVEILSLMPSTLSTEVSMCFMVSCRLSPKARYIVE